MICKLHGDWIIRKVIYISHKMLRIPMGLQINRDRVDQQVN
jgi:hypothetical protein